MYREYYSEKCVDEPVKISIIAPIYGVEQYIEEFAHSVLSQSYPYIEFVFVNDGTKDKSIEILERLIDEKYSSRRDNIKVVHKSNAGLPAARATGLEYATGDYVYHVDSDDWLANDAIKKIVEAINATNADIVYFNYVKEYPNRSSKKRERAYTNSQRADYVRNMYSHKSYGTLCNKCICRTLYTDNEIFIPKYGYAEDCCVTTQLVGFSKSIAFLDEYLYHYRKGNPSAMTSQNIKKRKKEYALNILDLYETYMDRSAEENPISVIKDDIVIQAGWSSLLYGFNLFKERSYLADAIRKAKIQGGSNVWLLNQIVTKLFAWFM